MIIVSLTVLLMGAITGWGMEKAAGWMIEKRRKPYSVNQFSGSRYKTLVWMLLNALAWLIIFSYGGSDVRTIEYALLASACIVLSAVDIATRKIPNEIIAFILIVGFVSVLLDRPASNLGIHLNGFGAGFLIFLFPAMIGKGAGMGDVKYGAVMGFCLGLYNFLAALVVMSVVLLCYTGYLLITKKGNLKTKVAMGPFMASGTVSVLLLSLVNTKLMFWDMGMFLK